MYDESASVNCYKCHSDFIHPFAVHFDCEENSERYKDRSYSLYECEMCREIGVLAFVNYKGNSQLYNWPLQRNGEDSSTLTKLLVLADEYRKIQDKNKEHDG